MATMLEKLKRIYEGFEYEEGRHSNAEIKNSKIDNPEEPVNEPESEEPEESFTDYINRKITNLQKTIEELKIAIEREQENIKNGHIGQVNGLEKINGWQSRLNVNEFKKQMLQKALEAYTNDQSEDNEYKLRMAAIRS